jgi:hypothetical protein
VVTFTTSLPNGKRCTVRNILWSYLPVLTRSIGDLVYVTVPGIPMVVINSYSAAKDLLGQGTRHAGRPQSLMLRYLCVHPSTLLQHHCTHTCTRMGWEWNPAFMDPSRDLNQLRAYIRQALGPQMIPTYRPIIYDETAKLLKKLTDFEGDPDEFLNTFVPFCSQFLWSLIVAQDHWNRYRQDSLRRRDLQ